MGLVRLNRLPSSLSICPSVQLSSLMDRPLHLALASWGDFYLITGTAAAALTGLQFVVQSLLASELRQAIHAGDPEASIAAFGTPTVVHFTIAVALSCIMCMPWPAPPGLQLTLALLGAGALTYAGIVLWRARRQDTYTPVGEDWLWHVALPAGAYTSVLVAGLLLGHGTTGSLFAVATATLLLLCIGIHNAWDTVVYLTVRASRSSGDGVGQRVDDAPPATPGS